METLKKAAKRYAEEYKWEEQDPWYDFMEGAKWQQERSYSEKEVLAMLLIKHDGLTPEYVLEQFKKK